MKKFLTGGLLTLFLMCGLQANANSGSAGGQRSAESNALVTTAGFHGFSVKYMRLDTVAFSAEADALGEEILIAVTEEYGYNDETIVPPAENYRGYFGIPASDAKVGDTIWTEKTKWSYDNFGQLQSTDVRVYSVVLYVGPASGDIVCAMPAHSNRIYMFGAFSKNAEDERYSESYASAAALSPVSLPYNETFANMRNGEEDPFLGWNGTKNFRLDRDDRGNSTLSSTLKITDIENRQEAALVFPSIKVPADSGINIQINIAMAFPIFGDRDSVIVEVSADGGKTFECLKLIRKGLGTLYMDLKNIKLKKYSDSDVLLRLRLVEYSKNAWNIAVQSVKVSATTLCGLPTYSVLDWNPWVKAFGNTLQFSWNASIDNESEWQVSHARPLDNGGWSDWSEPLLVKEKTYDLTGLEDNKIYKFRLRSVCGVGQMGGWLEREVRSNRVPTFIENFNGLGKETTLSGAVMPDYWKSVGEAIDILPDKLNPYGMYGSSKVQVLDWRSDKFNDGTANKSLAWNLNAAGEYALMGVLISPILKVVPAENPRLVFDLAYGKPGSDGHLKPLDKSGVNHRLELYISLDGGVTFSTLEPLRTWNTNELATVGDSTHVEIEILMPEATLKEYDSLVSFAFSVYGYKNGSTVEEPAMLYIDNFGVVNVRPTVRNLHVEHIDSKTATVSWSAEPTIPEWLVKLEGEAKDTMFVTSENTVVFTDLLPKTTYNTSVSLAYAPGDTADWKTVSFTTGGEQCDAVTDLQVGSISSKTAALSWNGTAGEYRIRIRSVAEPPGEWIYYRTENTTYTLTNLMAEVQYEGGVQALCSKAAADTSEYVAFESFTTKSITCNEPYALRVPSTPTQTAAELVWNGEAASYQVEWFFYGEADNPLGRLIVATNTCRLTDLEPATSYAFRVRSICALGDTSEWSANSSFFRTDEKPISCYEPTNPHLVGYATHFSVTVTWTGLAASYQVEWSLHGQSDRPLGRLTTQKDTCTIIGLEPETAYAFRVRSICAPGDTSVWSVSPPFLTAAMQDCLEPINLIADAITKTSARLSWESEGIMTSFILRYGEASTAPQWDSIRDLTENVYELKDLQPMTAYVWSVMSECSKGQYSGWADQAQFKTEGLQNEGRDTEGLYIHVSAGQIHLMNPSAVEIDRVLIYSTEGALLENYTIRSNENVLLTTGIRMKVSVVVVESAGRIFRFKTLLP